MRVLAPIILVLSMVMGLLVSCDNNEDCIKEPPPSEKFDRTTMLQDWADLIIIPAFDSYSQELTGLVDAKDLFISDPTNDRLVALRSAHIDAYKAWQRVAMFDIGKAEQIGLRNYTNVYPTDVNLIKENISTQTYNLELPSNFVAQGFPALDYLLYGADESEAEVLSQLQSSGHSQYLDDVVSRLSSLTEEVVSDWNGNYRQEFIDNDGASATASVDKMVNDFLFYYERYLRAGKIGLPAGVFTGDPIPNIVESYYSKTHSKELFTEGLNTVEDFFIGRNKAQTNQGESLISYLLHVENEGMINKGLTSEILSQFAAAKEKSELLSDDFSLQIETDNAKMLATYDELQKAVVLMKVDMMQAFNIQVDYVDADGD